MLIPRPSRPSFISRFAVMALRAFCNILLHRNGRYTRVIGTYVADVCKKASNSAWECCDFIVKAVLGK